MDSRSWKRGYIDKNFTKSNPSIFYKKVQYGKNYIVAAYRHHLNNEDELIMKSRVYFAFAVDVYTSCNDPEIHNKIPKY